jgi:hypothetical protein
LIAEELALDLFPNCQKRTYIDYSFQPKAADTEIREAGGPGHWLTKGSRFAGTFEQAVAAFKGRVIAGHWLLIRDRRATTEESLLVLLVPFESAKGIPVWHLIEALGPCPDR